MSPHPEPAKIRELCDRLEKTVADCEAAGKPPAVDFSEGAVVQYECSTTACFAGFAALALIEGTEFFLDEDGDRTLFLPEGKDTIRDNVFHTTGEDAINNFLFGGETWVIRPRRATFDGWAYDNPELWGNDYGNHMFFAEGFAAFDSTREEINMAVIIAHLRGVADRIEAHLAERKR